MATQSGTQTPIFGANAAVEPSLWSAPGQACAAVTKSDSTILSYTRADSTTATQPTRGLYIGGTGDVAVRMWYNQGSVTFTAVPVGSVLPIAVDQVLSTGTTATAIVAIF